MTKQMIESNKWRLSTYVLEGWSFSKVAKEFNISKAGSAKIFNKMKFKIFPLLYERGKLGIDMNDINSLRESWWKIKGI